MKMRLFYIFIISFVIVSEISATTIRVSNTGLVKSIENAALQANPGDTIFVENGKYTGGMFIGKLQGNLNNRIFIIAEAPGEVIIQGGGSAIQFSDPKFINIEGLVFEKQTGNGVNIDDGGDYSSPAENVRINNCIFRDMNASGNNDLLKLSGLNNFEVTNCTFENGAAGGSGIDMVGCHYGIIESNNFKNMGSNAIQAKGGTQFLGIYRNFFKDCGQRTLNIGGSTGLAYFRPIDAKFEASNIAVYANVFIGSQSPINYVGCTLVDVANNTIFNPGKWVIRILQETVDESRFEKCGKNKFSNNLIYLDNLGTETNIGPNTAPETFKFENNFWSNFNNSSWEGPDLPNKDLTQKVGQDPKFKNTLTYDFNLEQGSPAIGIINDNGEPLKDYNGNLYSKPRSAGAFEGSISSIDNLELIDDVLIYPNPSNNEIWYDNDFEKFEIINSAGFEVMIGNYQNPICIEQLEAGCYYIRFVNEDQISSMKLIKY